MATRSTIAMEYADGQIGQVYCHWDGYLEHNGNILFEHYSDPFKTRELLDLGDISSLGNEIGVKHSFSAREAQLSSDEYELLYQCMTTFYGRDRGDDMNVAQRFFKSFDDYVENFQHEEYAYVLRMDGNWYVKSYSGDFELLKTALESISVDEVEST